MQGRIVTHTHLKIVFKWALHFSKLAITRFNSDTKLLQATINTATLQASLLLYASTTAGFPTTTVIHSGIVLYNISHSGSMFYFYGQNVIKFVPQKFLLQCKLHGSLPKRENKAGNIISDNLWP